MKLSPVISALRAHCPRFENRVGRVAHYEDLPECGKLALPAAYVLPGEEVVGEQRAQNAYWQTLTERFSVVVILHHRRHGSGGRPSVDLLHDVRADIWRALLGWAPDPEGGTIEYAGGQPLEANRAEYHYLFEFQVRTEIHPEDTRQAQELAALPEWGTLCFERPSPEPDLFLSLESTK
ncbi:MAG: hypothetical protein HamCj_03300 [Candidatus Hamiltonella defensa (Ceratovacuna japonica)]